ncbi:MAG TPA: hypothetical protein VK453_18455 [Micromonosporaceae bacterium]|nr:hypothetical protein [Micromonosporaceae bacterium]
MSTAPPPDRAPAAATSGPARVSWPGAGHRPRHAAPSRLARLAATGVAPKLLRGRRSSVNGGLAACAALAIALGSGTVHAAFTAYAASGSNSWSTGTVTFGPNSPATALFTVSDAKPGSTGNACVKITYGGSLPARVRLYIASGDLTGTGLGSYLGLQINEGTGSEADCSDFTESANDYNATGLSDYAGTLHAFAGSSTNHTTGVSAWNNVTTGATKTYQFRYFLQPDNAAIGKAANVTFTWEAQS